MADSKTQVAVIGAGPGGYAAAFLAADLGLQVTLIDPEPNPGGVCLYRGCIPSKALLHVSSQIFESRAAADRGVNFGKPSIQIDRLRSWKNDVVGQLTGGLGQLVKQRQIRYLRATAAFANNRMLKIAEKGNSEQTLSFENAVIATGSQPRDLPFKDLDSDRLINSTDALEIKSVPKKLLVIGGGYIGLEIGTVYAALGAKVSLVEMTAGLLPGVDRDLARILQKRISGLLESVSLETTVKEIRAQKNGLRVVIAGSDGDPQTRIFDRVLAAVGRVPNTGELGLDNTDIELDDKGFIRIDGRQQTTVESIYAIGDVAGEPMLAHKATHEGRVAAEVIAGRKAFFEPAAIPAVVFTEPEIAWAGLTETEAKAKQIDHTISRFPWAASGRAAALGRGEGVTKLLVDPHSERILGVGIVGTGAGELIAEGVLAIEMGANATDLGMSIHPHPTLSETLMEAAEALHGTATSIYRPKKK